MSVLCDCGLVTGRKEGKWMHYSLNEKAVQDLKAFLAKTTSYKEDCICTKNSVAEGFDEQHNRECERLLRQTAEEQGRS
jgi:DNA-binding transcriptional ArsR family regulator